MAKNNEKKASEIAKIKNNIINILKKEESNTKSNNQMRHILGCNSHDYDKAKEQLINENKIIIGKGYSGTIRLSGKILVNDLSKKIVSYLKKHSINGSPIGNKKIREELKIDNSKRKLYDDAKKILLDDGIIGIGSGKGGSIYLSLTDQSEKDNEEQSEEKITKNIFPYLKEYFSSGNLINFVDDFIVFDTHKGGEQTGKWKKPDFAICVFQDYHYSNKDIELYTFELKTKDNIDVTCIYEALNQNKCANASYVLLQIDNDNIIKGTKFEQVMNIASEFGIGIIIFNDEKDLDTWDYIIKAKWKYVRNADKENFINANIINNNIIDINMKKILEGWKKDIKLNY